MQRLPLSTSDMSICGLKRDIKRNIQYIYNMDSQLGTYVGSIESLASQNKAAVDNVVP